MAPNLVKDDLEVLESVSLKDLTTWRVGGLARYFAHPQNFDQVKRAIDFANRKGLKITTLGNGSNILARDSGFKGLVLKVGANLNKASRKDNKIRAQAGCPLSKLTLLANKSGSSCFNFLAGIPGTVGGGLAMNAGAFGREISDYLTELTYIDDQNTLHTFNNRTKNDSFDYRESPFRDPGKIILEAEFELEFEEDQPATNEIIRLRSEKFPCSEATAGSVFKNPKESKASAGELLDRAGVKGLKVGDAVVSHQHANFIVNKGHAIAKNILNVIDILRERVYKEFRVTLVTEVVVI